MGDQDPAPLYLPRFALTLIFCGVAAFALGLDLWTKEVAAHRLGAPDGAQRIEVVEGVLGYTYVMNKGIIFGGFQGLGDLFFWIALIAVPVIIVVFIRLRNPTWTMTVALAFVLGGAIGNLYDRFAYEAVRDFIYFYLIDWPIFNLADSFILVGTILLMLELTLLEEKKKKIGKEGNAEIEGRQA